MLENAFPQDALEEQFQERKADEQLAVYVTCIFGTLAIYVADAAIHGFGGYQLVYRLCSFAQWSSVVCIYILFCRRRRLLRFYDSATSLIAVWNNTFALVTPMVLDAIGGAERLEADTCKTRISTGIIRAMAAVIVCGFLAKVNTLHFVGVSLHVLSWWIICASLQGSTVHELICPLLSLAFLLALCIICVRKLQRRECTASPEAMQVSVTSRKSKEVQERLQVTGKACSRLLSAFCDAVFLTDMDFKIITHQEHYCSINKLNSIFGQNMDDANLLDYLYDQSEEQRFNRNTADAPLTGDVSFTLRFRVFRQHSETDLLETTIHIVPIEHGYLVAICGQAKLCSHDVSEGKKTPVKADTSSPGSAEELATAHEVMLPGSLTCISDVIDADSKIIKEPLENGTEKENSEFNTGCARRVNPQRRQLKQIGRPPQMKENESSQSCDDFIEDNRAEELATSGSLDKDAVIFANTAVSSTVVPHNDREESYDPNGWPSQEGSTFVHNLSVDWGMTARSSTWKADRMSGRTCTGGTTTWQQGISEVDALYSKLEAERLTNLVVRYIGLLTASCALVAGDICAAEARAEVQRHQDVEKALAAIEFNTSHQTASFASSGSTSTRKRSLQPLSLSRTMRQGTRRHSAGRQCTGSQGESVAVRHLQGTESFKSAGTPSLSLGLRAGSRGSSKFGSWRGLVPSMATHMTSKHDASWHLSDVDEHCESLGLDNEKAIFDEEAELEDLIASESIRQKMGMLTDPPSALDARSGQVSRISNKTGSETDSQGNIVVHAWVQTLSELRALGRRTNSSLTSQAVSKDTRSDLDEVEFDAMIASLESIIPVRSQNS